MGQSMFKDYNYTIIGTIIGFVIMSVVFMVLGYK